MLYINSNYTNLGYKIYTTILKNHMQKILIAIIGENQSVATKNRTILHTFLTIRDVIDVLYKSNLALISLNFCEPLQSRLRFMSSVNLLCHKFVLRKLILCFLSLVMETSPSMIEVAYTNIQSKTKINGLASDFFLPLYKKFARGFHTHTVIYYCG